MTSVPLIPDIHVLHLEDNLADAELIHALLRDEWPSCTIHTVQNRQDYLRALDSGSFDVILSDFSLPQFDGLSALALARGRAISAPFIFLSGTIGEENAVRALQNGATDYVLKDRPARLISAVRRALDAVEELRRRRSAELKLREQAELLDKIRDAIVVCDIGRRITYWNQGAERIFGCSSADATGRNAEDLFGHAALSAIESARPESPDAEWHKEVEIRTRNGQSRILECRVSVIRDEQSAPKSHLIICADVTEPRQLERQFYRSQRMESLGTLAGGIAHDLNNVLTPILMSIPLVGDLTQDPELLRIMGILDNSARRGATLIRQILAYARGAEGERTEVQLRLVVREVVALLGETLPKSIVVSTHLAPDLPAITADFTQISQVLMNLCVNSRDAMPNGGRITLTADTVTIDKASADAIPGTQPGRYVRLVVDDTGTGIAPEIIDRIFDPFFTTKGAGRGTGLGLSTALGIVRSHGGFLQVQSTPGKGTRFSLHFPASASPSPADPERPDPASARGSGETILVIDDDHNIREVIRAFLESAGYRILLAADGTEGLATFLRNRGRIRCVITDLMMPGLQGDQVAASLRAVEPGLPVILVSGVLGFRPPSAALAHGVTFLTKPMTGADLTRAVASALARR